MKISAMVPAERPVGGRRVRAAGWASRGGAAVMLVAAGLWAPATASAQGGLTFEQPEKKPIVVNVPDPSDPALAKDRYDAAELRRIERELRKLRQQFFRSRSTEIREAGIAKLRAEYSDPALYSVLLEVFEREDPETLRAVLRMYAEQESDEAEASIAWTAVFGEREQLRELAVETLRERFDVEDTFEPKIPRTVSSVVQAGLARSNDKQVEWAAGVAQSLKLYEAIPWMASAQVQARAGERQGPIATIMVGQQQAYVSDLTPVVGDRAVAFDPTLAVVTDGVVMQVFDAVVVTYRMGVHTSLVDMTSRAWGRSTEGIGFDPREWGAWLNEEFLPYLAQRRAQEGETEAAKPEESGEQAPPLTTLPRPETPSGGN